MELKVFPTWNERISFQVGSVIFVIIYIYYLEIAENFVRYTVSAYHLFQIHQYSSFSCGTAALKLCFRNVKKQTAAVTLECWKADYPQILVNFGAVVDKLQRFAVKGECS